MSAMIGLFAAAAVFVGVGIASLVAPTAVFALFDQPLVTATARVDVRAIYGGLQVGLGVWLAAAAWRPTWHRPALWMVFAAFGGLALARLAGYALDGAAGPIVSTLLAAELTGAVLAAVLIGRLPP